MYNHSLHHGRKHFCCYCLQVFSNEGILKGHIKDSFKINDKQRIMMPKKGEYLKFDAVYNFVNKMIQEIKDCRCDEKTI